MVCRNASMEDGAVSGDTKAELAKRDFGLREKCKLSDSASAMDAYVLCKETKDEWELLVPLDMVEDCIVEESPVWSFTPNEFQATSKMKRAGQEVWVKYDEKELGENVAPKWVEMKLSL